jgi:N-methylhydantoinase B
MIDCLFGALAQAVPERVTADGSGGSSLPTFAGWRDERAFVFSETLMGNWGGADRQDGQEGVAHMGANQSNVPIELIEVDYPLRIERYGLEPDSGGPGRHRGGLAIRRDYRILADDTMVSIRSDKRAHPPHGLFGGQPGTPSTTVVNPGQADQRSVPVLVTEPLTLNAGDLFCHAMAGAGGYGDPFERDPQAVCDDVVAGKVSATQGREAYGVAVVEEAIGRARIDWEETRQLRGGDPS